MNKYKCDICDSNGCSYYGWTETHGYCDNPECKEKAIEKNSEMVREAIYSGDFEGAEALAGDGDIASML